jgi:hypothetical protein
VGEGWEEGWVVVRVGAVRVGEGWEEGWVVADRAEEGWVGVQKGVQGWEVGLGAAVRVGEVREPGTHRCCCQMGRKRGSCSCSCHFEGMWYHMPSSC